MAVVNNGMCLKSFEEQRSEEQRNEADYETIDCSGYLGVDGFVVPWRVAGDDVRGGAFHRPALHDRAFASVGLEET